MVIWIVFLMFSKRRMRKGILFLAYLDDDSTHEMAQFERQLILKKQANEYAFQPFLWSKREKTKYSQLCIVGHHAFLSDEKLLPVYVCQRKIGGKTLLQVI